MSMDSRDACGVHAGAFICVADLSRWTLSLVYTVFAVKIPGSEFSYGFAPIGWLFRQLIGFMNTVCIVMMHDLTTG